MLRLPALTALTGVYNLVEVERNLAAKLPAAFPVFRSSLEKMGIEIIPLPKRTDLKRWSGLTTEKDTPVLASALLGKPDTLVTGDKRHLLKIKNPVLPFALLSPAEFLNEFLPRFLKT